MELLKMLNLAVRFLLEAAVLLTMGYWGFKTGNNLWMRLLLGLGSPLLFAVVWGTFLAPKSALRLSQPWLLLLELVVFGLAGWALFSTAKAPLAFAFAALYILNKILMILWRQS